MSDSNKPLDRIDENRLKTRGKGIGANYEPFILVDELSSEGESTRAPGLVTGRLHHLLSGIEFAAFMLFDWYQNTVDIREQYPLPIQDTLICCEKLGIKHPQLRGKLKVVTTDLLIDLCGGKQLAVSVKPISKLKDYRVREILQLERIYWEGKGVRWRLFTDQEVSPALKMNLKWVRSALKEQSLIDSDESTEVRDLLQRLSSRGDVSVTKACGNLDDSYCLEPGTHIAILCRGFARKQILAPLLKEYHQWLCSEVSLNVHADRFGVGANSAN